MKDNFIKLKDSKGKNHEYRIILDIEDTSSKVNYIIYTNEDKNKNGDLICYASTYVLSAKGNITKLKPVSTDEEFDFLAFLQYDLLC